MTTKNPRVSVTLAWAVAIGALALNLPALAHHSFAMFDFSKTATVQGVVKEFRWTNPHVVLIVTAPASASEPEQDWTMELTSPGNLTRIGWMKMERAGLRKHLRFGAFAEQAQNRAGLVKIAVKHARQQGWIDRDSPISLIGDHPNDVGAAKANRVRSIAVATGVVGADELALHSPDVLIPDLRSLSMEELFG